MTTTKVKLETGTVRMSRIIKAPRERVFNAFLDADAYTKWIPPHGFTGHVHHMDARVGGTYRMNFSSLDKKETHFFGGTYLEIKPYEKIVHTDAFETDDPRMKGTMNVTITFKEVKGGTEVTVVQEGIPKLIPVEDATAGWGQSLDNLARLVEI